MEYRIENRGAKGPYCVSILERLLLRVGGISIALMSTRIRLFHLCPLEKEAEYSEGLEDFHGSHLIGEQLTIQIS